jgi:hypothetical protein
MIYVHCINNTGFIYDQQGRLFDETVADLVVGQVYRVAPPHENDGDMLRVIDASGEDYLYPATYFEPVVRGADIEHRRPVTVYLDDYTRDLLQAEALAAKKSLSALVREWIDDRLDLPASAH